MASIVTNLTCELTTPVSVVFLPGNMFSADNGGNIINVFVVQNGEPVALGGSISANVIRSDGTTVAITGAFEGNKAYVILPQACYAVPGIIHIVMKITEGTTITTIAAITANVYQSSTDAVVDPGQLIPSIAALIEAIEDAVDSIPVDYSGLLATLAADYSTSKTYKVGDYAWYGGVLKRCIVAITTAESYNSAHWTNAVIGDDLSALKSAIDELDDFVTNTESTILSINPEIIAGEYAKMSDGSFVEDADYSRTDYVPIWYAKTVYSTTNLTNCSFYDKNKTFISGSSGAVKSSGKAVPSNAIYIVFSSGNTSMNNAKITCEINSLYEMLQYTDITGDVFGVRTIVDAKIPLASVKGVSKFPGNLVDITGCTNGRYINTGTGGTSSGSDYFCTGFIPVTAGHTYKANKGRNGAWYSLAAKEGYISGITSTTIQSGVTAPVNAQYLRFSVNKTSDGISTPFELYLADATEYDDKVIIDGLISDIKPWCYGKAINWLGDSIVAGDDFDEYVSSALGLTETDYGIGGSTIALKADGTDGRDACCVRYANMADNTDIVAISAGTNDFEYAWCPIGTIDDPDDGTSNNTFYGALKALCKGLITKYPQKTIFFTTPIKRAQPFENGNGGEYTEDGVTLTPFSRNKYGKTLGDYADIIKEVCGYYSIPVLDLYRESMLNPSIPAQQALFDSYLTHPLDAGKKMMARRVCGWITQLGFNV